MPPEVFKTGTDRVPLQFKGRLANIDVRPLDYFTYCYRHCPFVPVTPTDHFLGTISMHAERGNPCPFCATPLLAQYASEQSYNTSFDHIMRRFREANLYESDELEDTYLGVRFCPGCSWTYHAFLSDGDSTTSVECIDILRPFSISSRTELLLTAIAAELVENWEKVHQLEPSNLERFVAAVARPMLQCETRWVGRSWDGGIDVIALLADEPVVLQVKRRRRQESVEGVGVVREFCGAMIAGNYKRGIVVSTANHFSAAAKATSRLIVENSRIESLDLMNVKDLCDIFNLIWRQPSRWQYAFSPASLYHGRP